MALFLEKMKERKILLIDDDPRNILALSAVLKSRGYKVVSANGMQDAFTLLKDHDDIGVVLIDMMMPGIDGYEATRLLKADQNFKGLPIIAVTAQAMKGDRERCLAAGASEYVAKPVDIDILQSHLTKIFQ